MQNFEKMRNVIVSGCSRGIGAEIARELLSRGNAVFGFARSETLEIKNLKKDFPEKFFFLPADLSKNYEDVVEKAVFSMGYVDALVNNAAIARDGVFAMLKECDIEESIKINLESSMKLTRLVVREMLLRKSGRIVNISSMSALRGYKGLSVYSASKAALDAFGRALARELGERSITVNSILPGFVETEMSATLSEEQKRKIVARTPLGRLARPADIAKLCAFLISDDAGFITGQSIFVDGGVSA